MKRVTTLVSTGLAILLAAGSRAHGDGGVPVPVSPGALDRVPVARSCPTFSWSVDTPADQHQIEVAAERTLADGGTRREPLYLVEVPGRGRSWTPSADRCVPAAGAYSWRLRSRSGSDWGSWSQAARFSVAPAAAPASIRRLLETSAGSAGQASEPLHPPAGAASLSGPPADSIFVGEPTLNVDGVLTVGELRSLNTMTATGAIQTTTGLSVAHGTLRARTLQVNTDAIGTVGVRLRTNVQFLELNTPGGTNGDAKLILDELGADDLIVGSITTGRSDWYPPGLDGGGSGFVEVDADSVKLDTSLDSCGTAPLQGVRLRIVDGDQIGVQLRCGAVPGQ